jgi:hypothetical protein
LAIGLVLDGPLHCRTFCLATYLPPKMRFVFIFKIGECILITD